VSFSTLLSIFQHGYLYEFCTSLVKLLISDIIFRNGDNFMVYLISLHNHHVSISDSYQLCSLAWSMLVLQRV